MVVVVAVTRDHRLEGGNGNAWERTSFGHHLVAFSRWHNNFYFCVTSTLNTDPRGFWIVTQSTNNKYLPAMSTYCSLLISPLKSIRLSISSHASFHSYPSLFPLPIFWLSTPLPLSLFHPHHSSIPIKRAITHAHTHTHVVCASIYSFRQRGLCLTNIINIYL